MSQSDEADHPRRGMSQTTAYQSNTRERRSQSPVSYLHNPNIKALLETDYAFLPISYRSPGFLFRGLESGLNEGVANGEFGINQGSHSLAALERELGVLLVSADFSDALTVSRIWESNSDAGILVIAAEIFGAYYEQHKAATLGFAEPGVVFKYPFFTDNLFLDEIAYLIVCQNQGKVLKNSFEEKNSPISSSDGTCLGKSSFQEFAERLIVIEDDDAIVSRSALSKYLTRRLADKQIEKATAMHVEHYPRK